MAVLAGLGGFVLVLTLIVVTAFGKFSVLVLRLSDTALLVCFDAPPAGLTFRGKFSFALTSVLGGGWTRDVSMEPTPVELGDRAGHMVGLAERREAANEGRMIFGEQTNWYGER
jgi:hypothetical protein